MVWIEAGRVYAFAQLMNPGTSVLTTTEISESKLRDRVGEVCGLQHDMEEVAAIKDGYLRAVRLMSYVHSNILPARLLALSELSQSGPAAVPAIRGMLDDPAFAGDAAES